jgi:hypothetical protein
MYISNPPVFLLNHGIMLFFVMWRTLLGIKHTSWQIERRRVVDLWID